MPARCADGPMGRWAARLQRTLPVRPSAHRLITAAKRLLGMPDYEAYCQHLREHHPGRPLPSEREFFDEFVRARYGDGPTRCC